jgi:apolipoprotein N-acyltransferase
MAEPAASLHFRTIGPMRPLQRAALWAGGLTGWRRHAVSVVLGMLAALALPPFDLTPILLVSFMGLVWLADGNGTARGAFALGWSFGFGFFLAGLYWIAAALLVDVAAFWWLIPIAVLGIPAGFAIFTGVAVLASFAVCRWLDLGGTARILVLAVAWAGAEWLRGHILTGFPWNLVGYAWSGAFPGALAVLQSTAVIGIYGLSLVTVLAAMLPARLGDLSGGPRWPAAVAAVLLIGGLAAGGAWRLGADARAMVPGVTLRLVQASIPQRLRNDPAEDAANFRTLLGLSGVPAATPPTAIIWSETAAPPFLDRSLPAREAIGAAVPPGGIALVGTVRTDPLPARPEHLWNSLVAIDHAGTIVATYDKSHLVPFGEYVPWRSILPINKITPGMIDLSAGPGPRTLRVPGLPPFSPLICYEAIFPGAVVDEADRPDWILNITNDAWYGFTSGPFQHLAIARVRAVEEGLPLVRDGDNGISAVVDPYGRLIARLDLDAVGVLDSALPRPLPATFFARAGDACFAGFLLLLLILAPTVSWAERCGTPPGRPAA